MTQEPTLQNAIIKLGDFELEVVMLSDGEYRISQKQIAELVNVDVKKVSDYLELTQLNKPIPYFVPLHIAAMFWLMVALFENNSVAEAMAYTSICEAFTKRCDAVFKPIQEVS